MKAITLFLSIVLMHTIGYAQCVDIDGATLNVDDFDGYKKEHYLTDLVNEYSKQLQIGIDFRFIDDEELACFVPSGANFYSGTIYFGDTVLEKYYAEINDGKSVEINSHIKKGLFHLIVFHEIGHAIINNNEIKFSNYDKIHQEILADLIAGYFFYGWSVNNSYSEDDWFDISDVYTEYFSDRDYDSENHHGDANMRLEYISSGNLFGEFFLNPILNSKKDYLNKKGYHNNMPESKYAVLKENINEIYDKNNDEEKGNFFKKQFIRETQYSVIKVLEIFAQYEHF